MLLEILNRSVGIRSRDKQILKNKQYQTFPKSNRKIVGTTDIISYIYNVEVLVFGSIGKICVFSAVKRKTKNHHTVGTVPKYYRKTKNHHTVGTVPKYYRKTKNHHTVGTVPKYYRKMEERGKIDTL